MTDTSVNGPQSASPEEIEAWIHAHYWRVMTPWQLDLVKYLLAHPDEEVSIHRPGSTTSRVIREARAVLAAQKRSSEGFSTMDQNAQP